MRRISTGSPQDLLPRICRRSCKDTYKISPRPLQELRTRTCTRSCQSLWQHFTRISTRASQAYKQKASPTPTRPLDRQVHQVEKEATQRVAETRTSQAHSWSTEGNRWAATNTLVILQGSDRTARSGEKEDKAKQFFPANPLGLEHLQPRNCWEWFAVTGPSGGPPSRTRPLKAWAKCFARFCSILLAISLFGCRRNGESRESIATIKGSSADVNNRVSST